MADEELTEQLIDMIGLASILHDVGKVSTPEGLAGRAIPLAARIVAVVDVFDALLHRRPYKEPWPDPDVVSHILQRSAAQFDPEVVAALLDVIEIEPAQPAGPGK